MTKYLLGTVFCGIRLFIYNPLHSGMQMTEERKKCVFKYAVDCLEHSYRMRTDPRLSQWSWLTRVYNEWQAFAVVLSGLCDQPLAKDADKAWKVVEQSAVLRWESPVRHHRVHQWRSVMRTIDKARRRRKKLLGRKQSISSARTRSTQEEHERPESISPPQQLGADSPARFNQQPQAMLAMETLTPNAPSPSLSEKQALANFARLDSPFNMPTGDSQLYYDSSFFNTAQMDSLMALIGD